MKNLRFKKLRLWLVYPAFLVFPFVARPTDLSLWTGIAVMFLGLVVRFWASGYISKSRILTTSGPYAYTRNPLYLGNFLLGLGVVAVANNGILMVYYLAAFFVLYAGTIKEEQESLQGKFGESYLAYIKEVPAFFPWIRPYAARDGKSFSIAQSFRNGEFIRISGFMLLAVFLFLWYAILIRKQGAGPSVILACILFVVFSISLCFNIIIRRKSERAGLKNI